MSASKTSDYWSLRSAIEGRDLNQLRLLVEFGCDVSFCHDGAYTHLALATKCLPLLKYLVLEAKVDVNQRCKSAGGLTALMIAASDGIIASVKFLLAHGADKTIKSTSLPVNAADLARANEHDDVFAVLASEPAPKAPEAPPLSAAATF